MLILTTSRALADFLRELVRRAPAGGPLMVGPVHCPDAAAMAAHRPLDADRGFDFVVIDLGSRALWPDLPYALRAWCDDYPATCFIYIMPGLDPDGEAELLGELTSLAPGCVLGPDYLNPERWWPILAGRLRRLIYRALEVRLVAAARPGAIVGWSSVRKVLEDAPAHRSVEEYCNRHKVERRRQWRLMHGNGQRPTRDLLRAFRLLWAVRLRERRWGPQDVAVALRYEDASDCARRVGNAFELGMRDINRLTSEGICGVYARDLLRTVRDGTFTLEERMMTLPAIGQRLVAPWPRAAEAAAS